jgi:hypothetical protein
MKKTLTIAAFVFLAVSTVALADNLTVTSQTSIVSPGIGTISSTTSKGFKGSATITFTIAGKTCNLRGSGGGTGVPKGCNYTIIVAPNGSISGSSGDNQGCTPSNQVAASCK